MRTWMPPAKPVSRLRVPCIITRTRCSRCSRTTSRRRRQQVARQPKEWVPTKGDPVWVKGETGAWVIQDLVWDHLTEQQFAVLKEHPVMSFRDSRTVPVSELSPIRS